LKDLINKLSPNQLLSIFADGTDYLYKRINSSDSKKTCFVGVYASGVVLAHFYNLMTSTRRPVWLFNVKPYVATHPIHDDNSLENEDIDEIVLFDESIKTGYTFSLYNLYLQRNMKYYSDKVFMISLFDYDEYQKVPNLKKSGYNSIYTFKKSESEINLHKNLALDKISKRNIEQKYVDALICYEKKDVSNIIDKILIDSKNKKRVDLSFLLTDTDSVFTICDKFSSVIIEKIQKSERNEVQLFAPLLNAEILAFVTALILKIKHGVNVHVFSGSICSEIKHESFLVGIDLSFSSGFTMAYNWMTSKSKKISFDQKWRDCLNDFDLILTVFQSSDDEEYRNLTSIYKPNDFFVNAEVAVNEV